MAFSRAVTNRTPPPCSEVSPVVAAASFLSLVRALNEHEVAYIVIGGLALLAQGLPRATQDIDLFIEVTEDNVARLKQALDEVYQDECIEEIALEDLLPPEGGVIRYGPPVGDFVIDLLGALGEAWTYHDLEAETVMMDEVPVRVATPRQLFRMKRHTYRPQDLADARLLAEKFGLDEG